MLDEVKMPKPGLRAPEGGEGMAGAELRCKEAMCGCGVEDEPPATELDVVDVELEARLCTGGW